MYLMSWRYKKDSILRKGSRMISRKIERYRTMPSFNNFCNSKDIKGQFYFLAQTFGFRVRLNLNIFINKNLQNNKIKK